MTESWESYQSKKVEASLSSFKKRVRERGGTVLEPAWLGGGIPHRISCEFGHEVTIKPSAMTQRAGICTTCIMAGREAIFQKFCDQVAELGGSVLDPWLGQLKIPHRIRCASGHETTRSPTKFFAGKPLCGVCSPRPPRRDRKKDWADFLGITSRRSITVLEDAYRGYGVGHKVRCDAGHDFTIAPCKWLKKEPRNICRQCASERSASAAPMRQQRAIVEGSAAAFRARVERLGGAVVSEWLGTNTKNTIRCPVGHVREVWPTHITQGLSPLCTVCTGMAPEVAEKKFRDAVERLGGVVLEPAYLGVNRAHRTRCAEGHESTTWPSHLARGVTLCSECNFAGHDVFYVVVDARKDRVKFGITSGDPRRRLGIHKKQGYKTVVRLHEGMKEPRKLETFVGRTVRDAGHVPVRGREHFDVCTLGLILDVVDNYPIEFHVSANRGVA